MECVQSLRGQLRLPCGLSIVHPSDFYHLTFWESCGTLGFRSFPHIALFNQGITPKEAQMKSFSREQLLSLYLDQEMNPYQIGELLHCDHKTVRRYLKLLEIPLRTASQYNFLARKNYISPSRELLYSAKSFAAHTAYLCEGWHTKKTNQVHFSNTDPQLIQLCVWMLEAVYQVRKIRYNLFTSKDTTLLNEFPEARVYFETSRKTPIIRVLSGGKTLARELIDNAYLLLDDSR